MPIVSQIRGIVDTNNATTTPLGGNATFMGTFTDVVVYSEFSCLIAKDVASSCTLHMDLSTDGETVSRTKTVPYETDSNGGVHTLVVVTQFMRVRVVNDSVAQSTLEVQVLLHPHKSQQLTSTMVQTVSNRDDVLLVRDPTLPEWDLAREFYSGKEAGFFFGNNPAVATTFEDIWPEGGTYPFQVAASVMDLVSANSNDSGFSTGTLTLAAQPADGDTFTLGSRTYTFQTVLTNVDGNIHISTSPASAAGTVLNIVDAIELGLDGEGSGTGYAASMTVNVSATAEDGTGDTVDFTSTAAFPLANDGDLEVLVTTATGADLSFAAAAMVHPAGCQVVELHGLSAAGADQDELIVMNGTNTVTTVLSYLRINFLHAQTVGTRGGSNYDAITLRVTGGGAILAVMRGFETAGTATYGHGEAGMGVYTVPLTKVAYLTLVEVNVDSTKSADVMLYEVEDCVRTASPFLPRRLLWGATALSGDNRIAFKSFVKIKQTADLVFRAKATSGTAGIEVKAHYFIADATSSGK